MVAEVSLLASFCFFFVRFFQDLLQVLVTRFLRQEPHVVFDPLPPIPPQPAGRASCVSQTPRALLCYMRVVSPVAQARLIILLLIFDELISLYINFSVKLDLQFTQFKSFI